MLVPRFLLRIRQSEVTVRRRGFFPSTLEKSERIEAIGLAFLTGYHAALAEDRADLLTDRLSHVEPPMRGFAFEGAAMGLAVLDGLSLGKCHRWHSFHNVAGPQYTYMLHVGYGWAVARLPWLRQTLCAPRTGLDPLYWWLAFDGIGFHQGYFHWRKSLTQESFRQRYRQYERRAFDQGLGRSLWFISGGDIDRVVDLLQRFHAHRHSDLWSGIGLACAYAGAACHHELARLAGKAGKHRVQLAQGVAFAAEARARAANLADWTECACQVICGMSAETAAQLTWTTRENLSSSDPAQPAYENWRKRISDRLERSPHSCPA